MGRIIQMQPKNSEDRRLFFAFQKAYEQNAEQLIQALTQGDKTHVIHTTKGDIRCTLQQCHGSDFSTHPYSARNYHVLLERDDKRYGCNIEHRSHPYEEAWLLNASSFIVHNQKYGFLHQHDHDERKSEGEEPVAMSSGGVSA